MTRLARSVELAAQIHADQKDRGGQPYILHPLHVMATVEQTHATNEEDVEALLCSAVLHDVIEDFPGHTEDIRRRVEVIAGERVLRTVEALTRGDGETWKRYIARVGEDSMARQIKLADLAHNMDVGRLHRPLTPADRERNLRYLRATEYLRDIDREP